MLRHCAMTPPRTALTCASALATHVRGISYAGQRGRVAFILFSQTKNESRPPQIAHAQFPSQAEHPLNSVTHCQIRRGMAAQNLARRSRTARLSALIVKQRL